MNRELAERYAAASTWALENLAELGEAPGDLQVDDGESFGIRACDRDPDRLLVGGDGLVTLAPDAQSYAASPRFERTTPADPPASLAELSEEISRGRYPSLFSVVPQGGGPNVWFRRVQLDSPIRPVMFEIVEASAPAPTAEGDGAKFVEVPMLANLLAESHQTGAELKLAAAEWLVDTTV